MRTLIYTLFALLMPQYGFAQISDVGTSLNDTKRIWVGFSFSEISGTGPAIKYNLSEGLSLKASFKWWDKIISEDGSSNKYEKMRDLGQSSFNSSYIDPLTTVPSDINEFEAGFELQYDLLRLNYLRTYMILGLGFNYNDTEYSEGLNFSKKVSAITYRLSQGVGIEFSLNNFLTFNIDAGLAYEYLDLQKLRSNRSLSFDYNEVEQSIRLMPRLAVGLGLRIF